MRTNSFLICALLCASLTGCVPVPRGNDPLDVRFMTTDDLRDYSEKVFRRQNQVTTRLMLAPPAEPRISDTARRQIDQAETRMNDACASLNEVAAARASGKDVDIGLENKVRVTVRSCARSSRRLEKLLDQHGIGSREFDTAL